MAMSNTPKHFVLTGVPGVGKSTLILKLCERLRAAGVNLRGFYTAEERKDGTRKGFNVVTLNGVRGPLARVEGAGIPVSRSLKVGRYVVKLQSFETIALPSLNVRDIKASGSIKNEVVVVDEVGRMELFSQSFTSTVRSLLKGDVTLLATIPVRKGNPIPLVEQIRASPDVQLFTVTRENRDSLLDEITAAILQRQAGLEAGSPSTQQQSDS